MAARSQRAKFTERRLIRTTTGGRRNWSAPRHDSDLLRPEPAICTLKPLIVGVSRQGDARLAASSTRSAGPGSAGGWHLDGSVRRTAAAGRVGEDQRPGRSWRGPCRRRTAVAWPCGPPGRAPGPRCIERPSSPLPAQVGDPVGLGGQLHAPPAVQPRSPLRLAHLADRRGDRRAGHPNPAGQHVLGDSIAQTHQGGR